MDSPLLRDDRRLRICRNPSDQTESPMASHSGLMREVLRRRASISAHSRTVRMARLALH